VSDFSAYLNFICVDRRVGDARSLYTATDALLSLEAQTVKRQERENEQSETSRQQIESFPVLAGLRKYALSEKREHTLLAGRPGSGKSTTLKQILIEMAEVALTDNTQPIPVLVQLKSDRPLLEIICAEFRRAKLKVTADQIDNWLLEDKLVLLLDGVNEIPSDELRQKLQEFRDDNLTTPMIFTTRDLAIGGDLGIKKRLEMRPLTDPQMREFVQKYLPEHGEMLLRQLNDRLRELAETPLLLKMLCDVFDPDTQQIPQSKGELFRLFDAKYDDFKGIAAISADFRRFKPEMLRHLAFVMMQGNLEKPTEAWLMIGRDQAEQAIEQLLTGRVESPGQRSKEWLEDLVEHHLLQVAADPRRVEFHHQLFQEYYAAETLLVMLRDKHPDVMDDQRFQYFYLNYLKWTEVVSIALSLLEIEDEIQILRLVELALDIDWILGARLAGAVRLKFRQQTVGMVSALDVPRWLKVQLWGKTRSSFAIPNLLNALKNKDFDSDARWYVPSALGELGLLEAVPGLEKALKSEDREVRKIATEALLVLKSVEVHVQRTSLEHEDSNVHEIVNSTIRDSDPVETVPELLKALDSEDAGVCERAIDALENLGSVEAIFGLIKALEHTNSYVKGMAAFALGNLGSVEATPGLIKALKDESADARFSAALALGKMGSVKAVPELLLVMERGNSDAEIASEALRKLGSVEAIPGFVKALEDENCNICETAFRALGEIKGGRADHILPNLLTLMSKKSGEYALYALTAIQTNCQFYNYEIAQWKLAPHTIERSPTDLLANIDKTTQAINQRTKQMTDQPTYSSKYTIHGNPTIVEGDMEVKGDNVGTKNIYFGSDETLRQQLADLNEFIAELETKHPNLQTTAEADEILEAEIVQVQTENPTRWQTLRRQMSLLKRQLLNPDRHLQATKATLIEVAKSACDKSLIVKAIITYLDKLSEEPNHGA
jgi:HEAT repeat protein